MCGADRNTSHNAYSWMGGRPDDESAFVKAAQRSSAIEMFLNCTSAGGLVQTSPFFEP
jgi:hypothetical protein